MHCHTLIDKTNWGSLPDVCAAYGIRSVATVQTWPIDSQGHELACLAEGFIFCNICMIMAVTNCA